MQLAQLPRLELHRHRLLDQQTAMYLQLGTYVYQELPYTTRAWDGHRRRRSMDRWLQRVSSNQMPTYSLERGSRRHNLAMPGRPAVKPLQ